MGAEVTVCEVLDRILPVEDEEVSVFAKRAFEKQGMARKHMGWYSKGLPASAEFRASVNRETEPAKVRAMLAAFFLPNLERQAA